MIGVRGLFLLWLTLIPSVFGQFGVNFWGDPMLNAPFANLGQMITQQVNAQIQSQLGGLNNLGAQIQQNVYQSLEPVRAMQLVMKMKGGIGGSTVVTYLPNNKQFIIKNNTKYNCNGTISKETGKCSGALSPFKAAAKRDYCYFTNRSVINNYICLSKSGTSISIFNNEMLCTSVDNSPTLLISLEEFRRMCDEDFGRAEYVYYADASDPNHVEIPNQNKHVRCSNSQAGVCAFSESTTVTPNSNVVMNGGIITYY